MSTPIAAQLMNNLSEIIMRQTPTPEIRHQAEAWARQALAVIERAEKMPPPRKGWFGFSEDMNVCSTCDQVLGAVLFNIGILREVRIVTNLCRWYWLTFHVYRWIQTKMSHLHSSREV